MGDLFKNILKENESLFLDEISLDFDYVPKEIPYREQSQHYIAECIKPLFQKRSGTNLFISGSSGIGKTLAVKHIIRELETETDEIIPIYINCWKKDTSFKIISEICEQIGYKWNASKRTDELLQSSIKILNKKSVVLCLDEVDKVKEIDILYNLIEEIFKKTIILITNNKEWLDNLDDRIKSRLIPELIEFKSYTLEETRGILKTRKDYAFIPNIFDKEAFNLVVNKTFQLKDIRSGLFLLRESGNQAEIRASKKITKDHTLKAIQKLESFKIKNSTDFSEDTQKILNLIKNYQGLTVNELYDTYLSENGDLAFSTFNKRILDLKKNKMINIDQGIGQYPGKIHYHKKLADF